MQRSTSFFERLSAHSAGAYTFYTHGHRGSQRIGSCTSYAWDTWPRVEEHSIRGRRRVPEIWASTSFIRSRGIRGAVEPFTVSIPWTPCPTERRVGADTYYTLDT